MSLCHCAMQLWPVAMHETWHSVLLRLMQMQQVTYPLFSGLFEFRKKCRHLFVEGMQWEALSRSVCTSKETVPFAWKHWLNPLVSEAGRGSLWRGGWSLALHLRSAPGGDYGLCLSRELVSCRIGSPVYRLHLLLCLTWLHPWSALWLETANYKCLRASP